MKKEKKAPLSPSEEALRIQQQMLAREVDEELQQERINAFWKKYGVFFVAAAVLAVLGTAAHELYKTYRHKVSLAESDQFEIAVIAAQTGDTQTALTELEDLAQTGKTGYRHLALLKQAGIYLNNNRPADAAAALKTVADDTTAPDFLRKSALLALIGHSSFAENTAETEKTLRGLLNPSDSFYAPAAELYAAFLVDQNKKDEAVAVLKQALESPEVSVTAKEKLSALLSAVE